MPDPLDVLRSLAAPALPDPVFAARLRVRLERALALPRGVLMIETTTSAPALAGPEPSYRHGDVGYAWLSTPDVDRAVTFHSAVLGWSVSPGSDPAGRQVQGRAPGLGLHGGAAHGTLNCCYAVDDVAAAVARVRLAGGRAGQPREAPYRAVADCVDDQGTVFALYQPVDGVGSEAAAAGGHGDLAYVTYEVVDAARARAFYGEVLGWSFTAGGVPDGWQVQGAMAGLQGRFARAATLPMWRVDDIAVAVERVRAAGGAAAAPQTRPYGQEAPCADDQGTRFYLGQL